MSRETHTRKDGYLTFRIATAPCVPCEGLDVLTPAAFNGVGRFFDVLCETNHCFPNGSVAG